jgi:hypothetical protein
LTRALAPLVLYLPGMIAIAAICLGAPCRATPPPLTRLAFRYLQQTTVTAVRLFLGRAMANGGLLAEASGEEVMRAWAGLGYYSRRAIFSLRQNVAGSLRASFGY